MQNRKKDFTKKYIYPDRYREVKQLRKKSGMDCSDNKIASIAAVHIRQLQNYIHGKSPVPDDSLNKICEYFDVPVYFLTGENSIDFIELQMGSKAYKGFCKGIEAGKASAFIADYLKFKKICTVKGNPKAALNLLKQLPGKKHFPIAENNIAANSVVHYADVQGESLTFFEYCYLIEEIETSIKETVDFFIRFKHANDSMYLFTSKDGK